MTSISLAKFGTSFSTRPRAHTLFDDIDVSETVVIDFKDVKEITPSFCHEMLDIFVNEKKAKVQVRNADETILFQLRKALGALRNKEVAN